MPDPIRILLVTASDAGAETVCKELRRGGLDFAVQRVRSGEDFAAALDDEHWDAVLAEHAVGNLTAPEAVAVVRRADPDLPFLVVAGPEGADHAVDAMRAGAQEYLTPRHLAGLVPAIRRELRLAAERRDSRRTQRNLAAAAAARERYEFIVNTSQDFMTLVRADYTYEAANGAYCAAMGKEPEEVVGRTVRDIWGEDTFDGVIHAHLARCFEGNVEQYEKWFEFGELGRRFFHVRCYPYCTPGGEVTHAVVISRDITERKRMELRLAALNADLTEEVQQLHRERDRYKGIEGLVGNSSEMVRLTRTIRDVAEVNVPVLIQGESGTGKELVANAIRTAGPRKDEPFVAVNCGALPEGILESELFGHVAGAFTGAIRVRKGRFELADGGTIFLDEVADLPPAVQVKLLRVLQEGTFEPVGGEETVQVDVRVLSATNKDLRREVADGRFREDLFYRLAVVPIHVPPLRDRREDIPLLADHILRKALRQMNRPDVAFARDALETLTHYPWPGNVRELENALQYGLVRCKTAVLRAKHLPPTVTDPTAPAGLVPPPGRRKEKLTTGAVRRALNSADGNKVLAAKILGTSRATLYRFLARHDLQG